MKGKTSPIIIGTRGSELALWQANFTKSVLERNGLKVELKIIKTKGDISQQWNLSFDKLEGKGFFTKELEDALLANEIDLAVHSSKDLPTENPEGLTIAAYSKRANPFDILLIKKESVDTTKVLKLKQNAIVGTSSARRKAQLLAYRPDILLQDLRGNVPTRIQKLVQQNYDAIVLASAGLERLEIDLTQFECIELKAPMFIPAPAQGILAFQICAANKEIEQICRTLLHDNEDSEATIIERNILHQFQGGCQMPLGVFAKKIENDLHVWISQAKHWDAIPKRTHFINNATLNISDEIEKLKKDKPNSIFISSNLQEQDYLVRVLKSHQYKVEYSSFIDFVAVDYTLPEHTDWLFFSSKNGVQFFFRNENIISILKEKNIKFAAINQGTAQAIFELGFTPSFIGNGSDLKQIASDFDEIANGKIVFPQAQKSMQSIQQNLQKIQI